MAKFLKDILLQFVAIAVVVILALLLRLQILLKNLLARAGL
jgi:hypothetical protein